MSKATLDCGVDSVDVALEKLYNIVEEHLESLPVAERKKRLEIIGEAHTQLTSQDSKKHSSKRRNLDRLDQFPTSR
jgi:uncharacterized protein (UPF0216 family)